MRKFLLFTLLISVSFSFAQQTGEVIITEIYNRPQKPTQTELDTALALPENAGFTGDITPNEGHTEWFELYNTTSAPVVMDGWIIQDESSSSNQTVIGSFTIPANSYASFTGFYIPEAQGGLIFDYYYDYKKPSFNNESSYADVGDSACPDGVILYKADGTTVVDSVEYDYGWNVSSCAEAADTDHDFPGQNGSSRVSFQLDANYLTATDNDNALYWTYSTNVYETHLSDQKGTPGTANDFDPALSVDNSFVNQFKIYPNPASDFIQIESNNLQISSVGIYSVLGKEVISQKTLTNNRVDVSNLSNGIYFMKINAEGGSVTKKVVIE